MCMFVCPGYPVSVSGVITVPVSASVYQSMVASMQQQDGVCMAPLVQVRAHSLARRSARSLLKIEID
ncbi:jg2759 [Pararge aegeria aegeria]|uniref:Jg2759 protein n=1 Tax=Pararge aegeria aegeria TaxID=348720 RepID=A0A8S4R8G3_9NEOP|nr:jg2759 [Pararge aegeria aegeria]